MYHNYKVTTHNHTAVFNLLQEVKSNLDQKFTSWEDLSLSNRDALILLEKFWHKAMGKMLL